MNQQLQESLSPPRNFFRTRAFWTGGVLWVVVLVALGYGWNRKRSETSIPPVTTSEVANTTPAQGEGEPKTLVLRQDKDGNLELGEPKTGGGWDADGIADFSFFDTDGKSVTKADLIGKPWIVCFVFTHCAATCPRVTTSMKELQDQLKDVDFRLVTLTVDPERDTPQVLKGYGERFNADFKKWSFLGGDQRDIYHLIHGSFKMPVQELVGEKRQQGFEFIHSNNIMLVDQSGVVRGKFDATKGPDMSNLRREIQKLAKSSTKEPDAEQPPE